MDKKEVARVLEEIAVLLELQGENPFKVRAYRNAARALLNADIDLKKMTEEKRLTEIEGIGDHIAEKITALVKKGHLPYYDKLKRSMPKGILELIQVQGLGPKKVITLYKTLKIHSVGELKKAAEKGKISKLKGFGAKTEKNILSALVSREKYSQRHLWWDAMERAEEILNGLKKLKGVKQAEAAGSLRRGLETIGDVDLVVAAENPKPVMNWFTKLGTNILAKGDTKSSIQLEDGLQVDIRIVTEKEYPFALCYFTGSKEHNIKMRGKFLKKGLSLSEYGFKPAKISVKSEEDIYQALKLDYIPPELRENRGEFDTKIPKLIEVEDIRGTFHNHTAASDGRNTLKEMVDAAEKMGWEYIGISDHSKSSFQANGLSEERLLKQIEEIKKIKSGIHVFAGLECDILADGSLDFSESLLSKLDYVIASVHSSLTQDEKTMTKRLIKAVEHPSTTMIGHLTGRLLLRREGYAINAPKIIDACIANKKIIELNGNPERLDMDWRLWQGAVEKGLLCCINTDAHAVSNHEFIRAGVKIARKGWLQKKDVINTLSLKEILKLLKKMHP